MQKHRTAQRKKYLFIERDMYFLRLSGKAATPSDFLYHSFNKTHNTRKRWKYIAMHAIKLIHSIKPITHNKSHQLIKHITHQNEKYMAAAEAEGYSSSSRRLPVSSFSVSSSEEMNHPHQNPINKIIRNLMNPTRTYGNKRISLLTRPSDHRNVHLQMDECWYSLPHHTTNTQEATTDNHTAQRPTDKHTKHSHS